MGTLGRSLAYAAWRPVNSSPSFQHPQLVDRAVVGDRREVEAHLVLKQGIDLPDVRSPPFYGIAEFMDQIYAAVDRVRSGITDRWQLFIEGP